MAHRREYKEKDISVPGNASRVGLTVGKWYEWILKHWAILFFILLLSAPLAYFAIPPWRAPLEGQEVYTFAAVGGEVWIRTDRGTYRMENGRPIPVLEGQGVFTVTAVGGEVWIGTDRGAYRVEGEKIIPVLDRPWIRLTQEGARYLPLVFLSLFFIANAAQIGIEWR